MEPPIFALTSYIQRLWRSIRPLSARKQLINSKLPDGHPFQPIVQAIHHALPDKPYKDLSKEEQALVDVGIYLLANQLDQAANICKHLLQSRSINHELGMRLVTTIEVEALSDDHKIINEAGYKADNGVNKPDQRR